ncbi:FHA domain-containing protein [Fervidobacterium thailandense]|uniref:FHA domain-containing protein n=1 Tax=Fervidobacterium thailandense TaxID=1008305 RepID=A0A1E3G540_9BACT|nr:FHA domain-containing protein [Fervidobacterium thailandense]ODN30768.1 hypothetical protein A4H02_04375 [Fervidobacterium thailandense]
MKRCLNCGMTYSDDTLKFCDCGGPLVEIYQEQNEKVGNLQWQQDDLLLSDEERFQDEQEILCELDSIDEDIYEITTSDFPDYVVGDDELDDVEEALLDDEMLAEDSNQIPELAMDHVDEVELFESEHSEPGEVFEEDVDSILREIFGMDEKVPEPLLQSTSNSTMEEQTQESSVISYEFSSVNPNLNDDADVCEDKMKQVSANNVGMVPVAPSSISRKPIVYGIKLTIYNRGSKVSEKNFWFDEILIGRSKTGVEVDVNLRDLDDERITSRKHAKIFKDEGKYFIQRLSQKAIVWVHGKFLEPGEIAQLYEGDRIILSNSIGLIVNNVQSTV